MRFTQDAQVMPSMGRAISADWEAGGAALSDILGGSISHGTIGTMESTAAAVAELGLVLLLAAGAGWLARRVGLPAVLGYLGVGLAVSPFTPGYVANREQIQLLADVGVVLLLFEVGIEIDVRRLRTEQHRLFWLVPAQMVIGTAVAGGALYAAGLSPAGSAIIGLCVAMSSTVVVVNITRSVRRTTDPGTEREMLGWSLLQDVTLVVMATVLLAIAGADTRSPGDLALGVMVFAAVVVAVSWALPRVLAALRTQHDLFLIVSVAIGLAIAGVGAAVLHLPLALAAFIAGLAITESDEATEARQRLLPFRDLLAVLFFVAIGTLINPVVLGRSLGWLGLLLALVIVAKSLVVYILARAARLPARPLQLAIGLSQVGEFSFVLAAAARSLGVIGEDVYVAVLAAVAVTIGVSAVGVRLVGRGAADGPAELAVVP